MAWWGEGFSRAWGNLLKRQSNLVPCRGVDPHKSASLVMTRIGQTFQKYFRLTVSEDLLGYAE